MSGGWLGRPAILLLAALVTAVPASADGPGRELERLADADHTFTSPDGQVSVEQFSKKKDEYDRVYQFWTFDGKHQNGALLNRDEDTDLAGHPAGFRFSPNSQWLVRMQKLGAGYHTLFLYRRTGDQFSPATPEAPRRHGLGLFLQPAAVQEDASEIQGSRFAQSLAGTSGPWDGR